MIGKWFSEFVVENGKRFIYGTIACSFAFAFMYFGTGDLPVTGSTILIGVAMHCFNKMRGDVNGKPKE